MGFVLAAIAVVVLVGLGYLVGRGPSDARRTFLLIVSGASLFVAAVGVVTALFGVVQVSLPGSVSAGGGRGAVLRSVRAGPGMGGRFQVPSEPNGAPMMGPRIGMAVGPRSSSSVRSAGLVMILRGVVLALVAGAIYRYHWPMTSEPAAEPPPATRTRRQAEH